MEAYLLVDDAEAVRLHLAEQIRRIRGSACRIEHASTSLDAVAAVKARPFRAVITGLGLADGHTGQQAIEGMLAARPETPIAICTSRARDSPEVRAGMSAGARAYLGKPVRMEQLRVILMDLSGSLGRIP